MKNNLPQGIYLWISISAILLRAAQYPWINYPREYLRRLLRLILYVRFTKSQSELTSLRFILITLLRSRRVVIIIIIVIVIIIEYKLHS